MAEVIEGWPGSRPTPPATFEYPWEQWATLDENGHGDIWLAARGVDFPASSSSLKFRGILYNRAQRVTKMRERDAPITLRRVTVRNTRTGETREKVKRVPDFKPLRVRVQVVSEELVAFQFYDSPEPPPEPEAVSLTVPRKRRVKLHQPVTRRTYEKVGV